MWLIPFQFLQANSHKTISKVNKYEFSYLSSDLIVVNQIAFEIVEQASIDYTGIKEGI